MHDFTGITQGACVPPPARGWAAEPTNFLAIASGLKLSHRFFGRQAFSPPMRPAERTASRNLSGLKSWPTDALRSINGVEVEFIAGYGTAGADVPPPIREALSMCVGDAHSNREGSPAKREKVGESEVERFSPGEIPLPAKQLLQIFRGWIWA